jgi:hypothetical protein
MRRACGARTLAARPEPCNVQRPRGRAVQRAAAARAVLLPHGAFLLLIVGLAAAFGPARRGLRSQPIR